MNIVLINPPNCGKSIPEERYGIETIKMIFRGEPLSLETLAGNLSGHEVSIIDLKAEPDGLEKDRLIDLHPDLIGITGVTCEANTVLKIAESLKSAVDVPIVVGGHHASCDPSFFRQPFIDYIVMGIGKRSFRELVDAIVNREPVRIPGVVNNTLRNAADFAPRRYTQDDLVDDKAPRYDLVACHRDKYVMSGIGGKVGFVSTAFGCTHGCAFCCIPNMTGRHYLTHSNDAVLRDIQLLGDVPIVRLVDANTFGNVKTAMALGQKIIDAGIQKRLVADVRSDTVVKHPELFALWKEAGLSVVVIGFEEISNDRLKTFNKKNFHETNLAALGILKDLGIRIVGDFIVSPDYTHKDFERLVDFVASSGIDVPIPAVLTPLPGTPLFETLRHRITNHDLDYYTFTNAVFPTRMAERDFYSTYSDMLKRFLAHLH